MNKLLFTTLVLLGMCSQNAYAKRLETKTNEATVALAAQATRLEQMQHDTARHAAKLVEVQEALNTQRVKLMIKGKKAMNAKLKDASDRLGRAEKDVQRHIIKLDQVKKTVNEVLDQLVTAL